MTFTTIILEWGAAWKGRGFGPHHSDLARAMPVFPAGRRGRGKRAKKPAVLAARRPCRPPAAPSGAGPHRGALSGPGSRSQDFIEVETAALQVSPGNETHLHAFATDLIGPGGERPPLYLRTSPEFACKKLLAAGETRIFDFARVFRNRERGALHHPEFTMLEWYRANEPYETLMDDCAALMAEAARAVGAQAVQLSRQDHRSVRRARARHRGGGLRAPCRRRSAGDGQRRAGRSRGARGRSGQGRRHNRGRRHLGRHLQPHSGRAGRAAARHWTRDHII